MTAAPGAGRVARRLAWAVVVPLVPARDREALLGDLAEEATAGASRHGDAGGSAGDPDWWQIAAVARVGLAYQQEPYRDEQARLALAALLLGGLLLLRVVPLAAAGLIGFVENPAFDGRLWRAAAGFWAQGALVAAGAAGLIVGRAAVRPAHLAGARWHVAAVLAATAALTAPTWRAALAGAALLPIATWVGESAARSAVPPSAGPPATSGGAPAPRG